MVTALDVATLSTTSSLHLPITPAATETTLLPPPPPSSQETEEEQQSPPEWSLFPTDVIVSVSDDGTARMYTYNAQYFTL